MQKPRRFHLTITRRNQIYGLAPLVGLLSGLASAVFLLSLDAVTHWRTQHNWVIYLIPIGGLILGWILQHIGRSTDAGNILILDEICNSTPTPRPLPLRMAPLILFSTLWTHLFGGSAGREGTAVQMGAALADQLSFGHVQKYQHRRLLLMCGMSAGFASVFGTPFAGTIFALEVVWRTKRRSLEQKFILKTDNDSNSNTGTDSGVVNGSSVSRNLLTMPIQKAFVPCLIAALIGHWTTTQLCGVQHSVYQIQVKSLTQIIELALPFSTAAAAVHSFFRSIIFILLISILSGIIFGGAGYFFSQATHRIKKLSRRLFSNEPLRLFAAGIPIALLFWLYPVSEKYLGLGLETLQNSFSQAINVYDFALKLLLTAWTLGFGFKGGEVTPLFFIGATLGNAIAQILTLPLQLYSLLAAMGFAAVFAAAAKTPFASTIMAAELFGWPVGILTGIACSVSHWIAGDQIGIYIKDKG